MSWKFGVPILSGSTRSTCQITSAWYKLLKSDEHFSDASCREWGSWFSSRRSGLRGESKQKGKEGEEGGGCKYYSNRKFKSNYDLLRSNLSAH